MVRISDWWWARGNYFRYTALDALSQIKTETAYRRWRDHDGREIVKVAPLMLRYVYPQEMEALLHHNGFVVLERYGDMDFSSLSTESDHMIYICRQS